jgi:hypothetical protein
VTTSALQALLGAMSKILAPLADAGSSPAKRQALLAAIGWDLSAATGVDLQPFDAALAELADVAAALAAAGDPQSLDEVATALGNVQNAFTAIEKLPQTLSAPSGVAARLGDLAVQLAEYAVFRWLSDAHPRVAAALMMLGVYHPPDDPPAALNDPTSGAPIFWPQLSLGLDPAALSALVKDPASALTLLAVGTEIGAAALDAVDAVLFPLAGTYLRSLGLPVVRDALPSDVQVALGWPPNALTLEDRALSVGFLPGGVAGADVMVCVVQPPAAGARPSLVVLPQGALAVDEHLGAWHVTATATGTASVLVIDSAGTVTTPDGPDLTLALSAVCAPDGGDAVMLGPASETHLEVQSIGASLTLGAAASWDLRVGLTVSGTQLLIKPGGFLAQILPGNGTRISFDSTLEWSRAHGVRLTGPGAAGSGLLLKIPLGASLGPVTIPELDLRITPGDGGVDIDMMAGATAVLGPFAAALDRIGIRFALGAAPGAASPASLALTPVLPTGVGLAISSDTVTGGGYLSLDPDTGSYVGVVQLHVADVGVSAVGLLSTKLPDGSPGFSLLVVISAQFPPVQLGFGFALVGLGGLLGVNRTTNVTALQSGLQAGALDSVLFPADIVARAQRVVSDLGRYFPVAAGQYVLGPTAELTWGEGNFVTATLGVFIELPSPTRVVVAGQIHIAMPVPQAPVVSIELDVLGVIDFTNKQLAIDAVLRNSTVAGFPLTGQAAVRAAWGTAPAFLFAAGGFNPGFTPPASFPALQRLQLALGNGNNPRLRLSAYFALTSNTVQFGAQLDLYAGIDVPLIGTFSITGMLAFDALVQFSPFAFTVNIAAGLALALGGKPLMGVTLDLLLSGPQPWHAAGTARINFLGSHTVQFAITTGAAADQPAPPQVDVAKTLIDALTDPGNWSSALPDGGLLVVLAAPGQPAGGSVLALHPLGALTVKQRVVPLNTTVTHIGSMRALDPGSHAITAFAVASDRAATAVTDWFAPAHFLDLDDAAQLSRPSFETMAAGAAVSGAGLLAPAGSWAQWTDSVDVTTTFLTPAAAQPATSAAIRPAAMPVAAGPTATVRLGDDLVLAQLAGSAAAQAGPRAQGSARFAAPPLGIALAPPTYAVATQRDLSAVGATTGGTPTELTYLPTYSDAVARQPRGPGLQVVETPDVYAPVTVTSPPQLDPSASYTLTAQHSGKCLEVAGGSTQDGAAVDQWDYRAAPSQQWQITPLGNGFCTVRSVASGLLLGVAGAAPGNGASVVQRAADAGPGQQWQITPVATGWFSLQNAASGRCLDIAGGSAAVDDGVTAQVWEWYGGENQKWHLDVVPSTLQLRQQIRQAAYGNYVARGRGPGHALDDWLRAEAEVLHPLIAVRAYYLYLQRGRGPGHAVDDWLTAEALLRAEVAEALG